MGEGGGQHFFRQKAISLRLKKRLRLNLSELCELERLKGAGESQKRNLSPRLNKSKIGFNWAGRALRGAEGKG